MPDVYGIGRDGSAAGEKLPWAKVEDWLRDSRNYWICTTRSDGRPHAKPVWGIWMEGMVVFSTAPASVTGRNLRRDPRLVIHLESGDEVAILEGKVGRLADDLFESYADAYEAKYDYRPPPTGEPPWALGPEKVLSWTEAEFPGTATRWSF
jgi:pyridoxamine 5'-phosphate oxidase-like protein